MAGRIRQMSLDHEYPIYLGVVEAKLPWETVWHSPTYYYYGNPPATYDVLRPGKVRLYCVDETHAGPPYRTGGPFAKMELHDRGLSVKSPPTGAIYSSNGWYRYTGGFVCIYGPSLEGLANFASPSYSQDDFHDVQSWGATAWNRFKPGKPTADLGVFIGEIKDLPRMLQTTAGAFSKKWRSMGGNRSNFGPKSVANHWLNTQFGWLPFVNDMRKFYNTYKNLDNQLNRLKRENGRWVKHGGTCTEGEDVTPNRWGSDTGFAHSPSLATGFYAPRGGSYGKYSIDLKVSERVWFEARFRYYVPDMGTSKWRKRAVRQLFGGSITPSLLWELTPWSWLADWFTNAGDVIANMSDGLAENLAAKYAYVMGWKQKSYTCTSTCYFVSGDDTCTWTWDVESKQRQAASPFGFGLTGADLSARQLSILSALGISRLM